MDKKNVDLALSLVGQDILMLRGLMNEVSHEVDSLSHPIMVKISEMMDSKLNQRNELLLMNNESRGCYRPKHFSVVNHLHLS